MIKIANNLQRMLEKVAAESTDRGPVVRAIDALGGYDFDDDDLILDRNLLPVFGRTGNDWAPKKQRQILQRNAQTNFPFIEEPKHSDPLPGDNVWRGHQRDSQAYNQYLRDKLFNPSLSGAYRAYKDMIGPNGLPLWMSWGRQFNADTQEAIPRVAQDLKNQFDIRSQYANRLGGIGQDALSAIESNVPEAADLARSIADAGSRGLHKVEPSVQAYGQAYEDQMKGLGNRAKDIGEDFLSRFKKRQPNSDPPLR
jgi:hypothetical protein